MLQQFLRRRRSWSARARCFLLRYFFLAGRLLFFFPSRRRHTRCSRDWSSDVCSSDLGQRDVVLRVVVEKPFPLADGAMIFDAALNVRDLDAQYNITLPEDPAYATVGGFVLDQLGFIPKGGESFDFGNFRFSVVEMDGKRVARVKIQRVRSPESDSKPANAADDMLQLAKGQKSPRGDS